MTTFSLSFSGDAPGALGGLGSKDGRGCGDHDEPYRFGRRPRAIAPFPFTPSQFAHVLALRGCVGDGLLGGDDLDRAGQSIRPDESAYGCVDSMARTILQLAGVLDDGEA